MIKAITNLFKSVFDFRDQKKQLLLLVLVSYLMSFLIARLWALYIGNSIYIRGFQIHHFYFGTFILVIGSLLALLSEGLRNLRVASCIIGIGIGLFVDEIGLLLNCTTMLRTCAYAFSGSYDFVATISVGIFFVLILVDQTERAALRKARKAIAESQK